MSPNPDTGLTDLFVRYWDNALTPAEAGGLAARLASDPVARDEFRLLSLQAVAAAEPLPAPAPAIPAARRWSRRQVLGLVGGGVAASVAATILGRQFLIGEKADPVNLTASAGDVTLKTAAGEIGATTGLVPADAVVTTVGPSSSAVLHFADGSDVSLAGDSAVTVVGKGRKLMVLRGTATATVPMPIAGAESITVGTTEATVSRLGGAVLTLSRTLQMTQVGVQTGRATVADAAGDPLEVVHPGEYLTVQSDGRHQKKPVEPVSESCVWDLSRPLPEGWAVGTREVTADGPIVRPVRWFDPYHHAEMYQIRSDHRWYAGFAKCLPDTTFRVKYWVEKPGRSQLVACVRKDDLSQSDTGVIECNDAFLNAKPREWQWLNVKAGKMLDNKHTPKFGAPWVAFLIIFNTYQEDLGLRIASFEVIPPVIA
ncbi:MAG TPA: hypothetical protein VHR66_18220 [Gemmataceae bacterium]|nr:hypothetical protein [Gemmataceae bacterium]